MGKIVQLDRHVADLIAAGEVVERPASVVKELVENSMDAGATAITVEIRRGGLEQIRVSDNGSGISADDIRTAFLRHATSKIKTAEDLASIQTMGFRGEALASIASVSKITVFTRSPEDTAGLCYEIEGGVERSLEEAGCPSGTTILVKELFFNTPARMKFIKKDVTEAGQVQAVVRRAALARPDISFKFIKDGEELLHTPGDHSLINAIYCVYGGPFASGFQKTTTVHENIRVTGYVSKPVYSQGNRTKQEFFVNARPVRSRILSAAVEEAYKNRIMIGRYPACVLQIEINPTVLDVNVHPAKSEVKFAFERQVFDAVYLAVKDAIDAEDARAEIKHTPRPPQFSQPSEERYVQTTMRAEPKQDFYRTMSTESFRSAYGSSSNDPQRTPHVTPQSPQNSISSANPTSLANPANPVNPIDNPSPFTSKLEKPVSDYTGDLHAEHHESQVGSAAAVDTAESKEPTAPEEYQAQITPENLILSDSDALSTHELPKWKIIGEAFDSYLLVEDGQDLLFVDKHAAHERILFEKLLAEAGEPISQYLMEPVLCQFERDELDVLFANKEMLSGMGFEFDEFGGDSVLIRSLPEEVDRSDAAASLQEVAQSLIENRRSPLTKRREEALRLVACKAAIKAGTASTDAEKYALIERVMAYSDIKYCPHGRPVAAVLTKSELEKRFGRI